VSALAGCYWFDQRPASIDDLLVPTRAAAHRARVPFHFWCGDSVALAYADERLADPQPFHDAHSRTTVIVDGRIDNLADLANELQLATKSASALVCAAYRRWGVDAGARLLGDWVVIVYDEAERRLWCLRDPMGQRPFFYGIGPHGIVFGSEAQQVVRHPAIPRDVNEGAVAEHLTNTPTTVAETLWKAVSRLPPSHALEIGSGVLRIRQFWDFDPGAQIVYARPHDYDDHFRHLFEATVACRVSCDGVGVMLSGGLDSSAVAAMAQSVRLNGAKPALHAFTVAFPGHPCDESSYVDAVVEKWRLPLTRFDVALPSRAALEQEAARYLDLPFYPNSLVADPLRERAAGLGLQVILTGCGGDELFAGNPVYPVDLLREGRVIAGARALIRPLLSERARRLLKPVFGARGMRFPWIRPEFAERTGLADRRRPPTLPAFPSTEQQDLYEVMNSLLQVLGTELEDRAAQTRGLEARHPLYDRRMAEFGLGLPSSERWQGRQQKVLLRRALRDYLPPLVADRQDKAEFSPTYVETLAAIGGRALFTDLRSHTTGWVDGRLVSEMYERMIALYSRGDDAYIALMGPLFTIAALEIWLQKAEL
jgi:asparagine synthase (glutamine-hydrolysing)